MGCDIHCYLEHRPTLESAYASYLSHMESWKKLYDKHEFEALSKERRKILSFEEFKADKDHSHRRWWGFPRINPGRNYLLFGFMAGVRCGGPPVVEPRGVPEDMGLYSHDDYYLYGCHYSKDGRLVSHPDWHTHSWLTMDEFERAIVVTDASSEYKSSAEYRALLAAGREMERQGNEVRLVFWFDN